MNRLGLTYRNTEAWYAFDPVGAPEIPTTFPVRPGRTVRPTVMCVRVDDIDDAIISVTIYGTHVQQGTSTPTSTLWRWDIDAAEGTWPDGSPDVIVDLVAEALKKIRVR